MPTALPKIRDDLLYSPDHESPGYNFVKCPVRNDFFRFNDIQCTLMRAMDGRRSVQELIDLIGDEYEVEMDADQIDRFVTRLGERFLLDIASYQADDKATSKSIQKKLAKAGFLYRVKARDENNPEANLFALGMQQALGQNPLQAASYFQAILEINPDNQRARQVLDCIHQAFLNMRRKDMAHGAKSIPLVNPDKFLGRLDGRIGNFTFSLAGALVVTFVCLLQIPLFMDLLRMPEFQPSSFGIIDLISFLVVMLTIMLFHELGHAFACRHYGGHPNELGLQLVLGILPAAYCDASDTYLFKSSRHKVICFMSGIPAQLMISTVLFAMLLMLDPGLPGWTGAVLCVMYGVVTVYQNLNPLIPFDGYYALGDYFKIINLRERSFDYVWQALAYRIFGVASPVYKETEARERRIFFIFGILAMSYTVFWITVIMLNLFVPLAVEYLGLLGVLLVALYAYGQIKLMIFSMILPFARFLIRERKQIFTWRRAGVYTCILVAGLWMLGRQGHVHVEGSMVVEPMRLAQITATEAGVIEDVKVQEGELVQAGQLLFALNSEELDNEVARAVTEVAIAELKLSMLNAGARPEAIKLVIAKHQAARAHSSQMSARLRYSKTLRKLDVQSDVEMLRAKGEAVQAFNADRISESEVDLLMAGARDEEIKEAQAALERAQGLLAKLEEREERLQVRAPFSGRITTRDLRLLQGRWVPQGETLCDIADESGWRVRVRPGLAEPIAGLGKGDRVIVRAFGRADEELELKVAALLPPTDEESESIIIETTTFAGSEWRSGLSGRARVYGPKRSFAYRWIAIPIVQLINVRVVPLFNDV